MKNPVTLNIISLGLLIISLSVAGCSSQLNDSKILNLKIVSSKINVWINLMPGVNRQPSLHLNGKVSVKNLDDIAVDNVILRKISLIQNDGALNFSKTEFVSEDSSKNILPQEEKTFFLNCSHACLRAGKKMSGGKINYDSTMTLILYLSSDGKSFTDSLMNLKIQKVY
ncbi:MAG: hypothetical protein ACYCVH_12445 [Ignavibacteriaceae bacterium]